MRAKPKRAAIVTQAKRKVGRPSIYTSAIADEICDLIAANLDLGAISQLSHMPGLRTIHDWLADSSLHADFRAKYAHARELQAECNEARVQLIASKCEDGKIEPDAARVAINAHTWLAKVRSPKRYGDRTALEHSGADGGPIVITVRRRDKEPA